MSDRLSVSGRLVLPLVVAIASSCGDGGEVIRVGVAGPFSEERGRSMLLGAQLAAREINDAGGVDGRRLELVVRDDSAKPDRAVEIAAALRDDPRVIAVIGHLTSGTTLPAVAVYHHGADPLVNVSPSASAAELSGAGSFSFRVCASDEAHGPALARWAYERLGMRSVAALYLNDDYGRGVLATFAAEFERLGGRLSERDPFLANTTDFSPYLERIRARGQAEGILVAGTRASASVVLRQARALGLTMPLLGADALTGIQGDGAIAEGVYVSTNYLPDLATSANAAFVRAYAQAYPGETPDHRGAGAYDAVHLIAAAVRDGGASRRGVRNALAELGRGREPYAGVTGTISFDERGDVPGKQVLVGVIRGGRLVMAESR